MGVKSNDDIPRERTALFMNELLATLEPEGTVLDLVIGNFVVEHC